jgi:GDP-D-mannose dehydratase
VTKARTKLGWHSKHDIRSVIHHTMKYFVDQHRAKQKAA